MNDPDLRVLSLPAPRNDTKNHYAANLKQFYGLKKDVNELRTTVEKLISYLVIINKGRV